jgi:hypothetical protein
MPKTFASLDSNWPLEINCKSLDGKFAEAAAILSSLHLYGFSVLQKEFQAEVEKLEMS